MKLNEERKNERNKLKCNTDSAQVVAVERFPLEFSPVCLTGEEEVWLNPKHITIEQVVHYIGRGILLFRTLVQELV